MEASTAPADTTGQDLVTTTMASVGRVAIWIGIGTLVGVLFAVCIAVWVVGRHDAPTGGTGHEGDGAEPGHESGA